MLPTSLQTLSPAVQSAVLDAAKRMGRAVDSLIIAPGTIGRTLTLVSASSTTPNLDVDQHFIAERVLGSAYLANAADYEGLVELTFREAQGAYWFGESKAGVPLPLLTERENGIPLYVPRLFAPGERNILEAKADTLAGAGKVFVGLVGLWLR